MFHIIFLDETHTWRGMFTNMQHSDRKWEFLASQSVPLRADGAVYKNTWKCSHVPGCLQLSSDPLPALSSHLRTFINQNDIQNQQPWQDPLLCVLILVVAGKNNCSYTHLSWSANANHDAQSTPAKEDITLQCRMEKESILSLLVPFFCIQLYSSSVRRVSCI